MNHFPMCFVLALCARGYAGRAPNPIATVNPSDTLVACIEIHVPCLRAS
jgi:hypothetical protein